jgi:hypothetical protein
VFDIPRWQCPACLGDIPPEDFLPKIGPDKDELIEILDKERVPGVYFAGRFYPDEDDTWTIHLYDPDHTLSFSISNANKQKYEEQSKHYGFEGNIPKFILYVFEKFVDRYEI